MQRLPDGLCNASIDGLIDRLLCRCILGCAIAWGGYAAELVATMALPI